ncbi:hypothetical protein BB560_007201 [Smittium megazygosporum]|uniref:Protein kinase domain-containing protein n=1 Tax=Smittium megazygosporum TaxID=133381 RepID=A0A2T9XY01_9FUNG|nr:hypothetical protein BB560_007201 [Smittium megazygosporum]
MKNYTPIKIIGEGAFSSVILARSNSSDQIVAVKKMKKRGIKDFTALAEADALQKLNHPNIVRLLDVFRENYQSCLVFELMDCDLHEFSLAQNGAPFPPPFVLNIACQVLSGLKHIHELGLFHRDMKPENILVKKLDKADFIFKISDFGLVRETKNSRPLTTYISTRWYRAPEMLLNCKSYSKEVDIWAVGAILAELALNKPIFPGTNSIDQIRRIFEYTGTPLAFKDSQEAWPDGIAAATSMGISKPKPPTKSIDDLMPNIAPDLTKLFALNSPEHQKDAFPTLNSIDPPKLSNMSSLPSSPPILNLPNLSNLSKPDISSATNNTIDTNQEKYLAINNTLNPQTITTQPQSNIKKKYLQYKQNKELVEDSLARSTFNLKNFISKKKSLLQVNNDAQPARNRFSTYSKPPAQADIQSNFQNINRLADNSQPSSSTTLLNEQRSNSPTFPLNVIRDSTSFEYNSNTLNLSYSHKPNLPYAHQNEFSDHTAQRSHFHLPHASNSISNAFLTYRNTLENGSNPSRLKIPVFPNPQNPNTLSEPPISPTTEITELHRNKQIFSNSSETSGPVISSSPTIPSKPSLNSGLNDTTWGPVNRTVSAQYIPPLFDFTHSGQFPIDRKNLEITPDQYGYNSHNIPNVRKYSQLHKDPYLSPPLYNTSDNRRYRHINSIEKDSQKRSKYGNIGSVRPNHANPRAFRNLSYGNYTSLADTRIHDFSIDPIKQSYYSNKQGYNNVQYYPHVAEIKQTTRNTLGFSLQKNPMVLNKADDHMSSKNLVSTHYEFETNKSYGEPAPLRDSFVKPNEKNVPLRFPGIDKMGYKDVNMGPNPNLNPRYNDPNVYIVGRNGEYRRYNNGPGMP